MARPAANSSLTRQVQDLQRTVDRLNILVTITGSIAGLFAVMIVGGVVALIGTVSRFETIIANQSKQLDKLESRLESFEKGDGPFGQQLRRLQDQVDALQRKQVGFSLEKANPRSE